MTVMEGGTVVSTVCITCVCVREREGKKALKHFRKYKEKLLHIRQSLSTIIIIKSTKGVVSRSTDAGVRDVSHSAMSVAVMFEQTLHLILLHAGLNATHHLTVGRTAYLVGVTEDGHFQGGLDHTAMWGAR